MRKTLCRAAALFLFAAALRCLTPEAYAQAAETETVTVGWTDYLLVAGAAGVIAGVGHLALRAVSRRFELYESFLHKKYGRFTKDEEPPQT